MALFPEVNAALLTLDIDAFFVVRTVGLPLETNLTAGIRELRIHIHEVAVDGVGQAAQGAVSTVGEHHLSRGLRHHVEPLVVGPFTPRDPVHVGCAVVPKADGLLVPVVEVAILQFGADGHTAVRAQLHLQHVGVEGHRPGDISAVGHVGRDGEFGNGSSGFRSSGGFSARFGRRFRDGREVQLIHDDHRENQ